MLHPRPAVCDVRVGFHNIRPEKIPCRFFITSRVCTPSQTKPPPDDKLHMN